MPGLAVAGVAFIAWVFFRICGELVVRWLGKRWFGRPEPGSMRLMGRGQARPIQSFESLAAPPLTHVADELKQRTILEENISKHRLDWAALSDGLVAGSFAYAAYTAASEKAHAALVSLPTMFDHINVGAVGASNLTVAQQIGYQSWIEGHIGESVAANVLSEHGHHVVFAALSNQPGWDLLVDGIPTQVKVGQHAVQNIAEHFGRYPEIPVVTDPHTAALLHNPMVQGLPGLEPNHVHSLAAAHPMLDSSHGWNHLGTLGAHQGSHPELLHHANALDHADSLDLSPHIPWITVGLVAFREVRLAERYGGSFGESIGAIAADATGVAVGAKAGLLVGSLLGPVGMIAGAIGGALLGKGAVNAARQTNVRQEIERLQPKLKALDAQWQGTSANFAREAEACIARWNREIRVRTRAERNAYDLLVQRLQKEHDLASLRFCRRVNDTFDAFDRALVEDIASVRRRFPGRNAFQRILWPSSSDSARLLAERWISEKRMELENWRNKFAAVISRAELSGYSNASEARALLAQFTSHYKIWDVHASPQLQKTLLEFDSIASQATAAHKRATKVLLSILKDVEDQARKELDQLWSRHESEIEKLAEGLDQEVRDVARHAARAHMSSFSPPLQLLHEQSKHVRAGIVNNTEGAMRLRRLPAFA